MQLGKIEITDADIAYAESILIPGNTFDDERREFIRNLETIDLQAVPGSGKTTALLAKLLILEKHLPFDDGSGILVLSHTNNAIDEIKKRIEPYCPKLFSYPNHVGTIQSFVDKYVTQPLFSIKYSNKIKAIDDNLFNLTFFKYTYNDPISNIAQSFLYKNNLKTTYRLNYIENELTILKSEKGEILVITKPKYKSKSEEKWTDYTDIEKFNIKNYIICLKERYFKDFGILTYYDSYFFASYYFKKFPNIINLIQKRFKYVFVDEMQDMGKHQYDLLERIFRINNSIYQRIGDINQSIYSNSDEIENQWENENLVTRLTLSGTKRLSNNNKEIVNLLSVSKDKIDNAIDSVTFKPKIIVFDNNTIDKVIERFAKVFYEDNHDIEAIKAGKHKIKCVGWIKDKEDEIDKKDRIKLSVTSYFPSFHDIAYKHKNERFNLETYIRHWKEFSNQKNDFNGIRKRIIDSLVFILLLEEVKNPATNKRFYVSSLIPYLKENHEAFYENFKSQLFCWCKMIFEYKYDEALTELRKYLPELLRVFDRNISNKSYEFINDETDKSDKIQKKQDKSSNIFRYKDLEIEVSTVHAVKGETHYATLYLETFYNSFFESEYLKSRLCRKDDRNSGKTNYIKATKVAYVAMSRPTHLLCFAIHRDRYDIIKNDLKGWDEPIELDKETQKE